MFWDVAVVYPAGVTWTDRLPPALLFNGPIIDITVAIEAAIVAGSGELPNAGRPLS